MKGKKILKKPQKVSLVWNLHYIIGLSIIVAVFIIFYAYVTAQVLFLNVMGIFIMALIACWTLSIMNMSTRNTVETMLTTSEKNIDKFDKMIENLWVSNERLGEVSKSLKVMSDEIVTQRQMRPQLSVAFVKGQKEISINAGVEKDVEFFLYNKGQFMAEQPDWRIFFPPGIEVISFVRGRKILQSPSSYYPNYTGISFREETLGGKTRIKATIKLKMSSISVGKIKVPYICVCKNIPSNEGTLIINAIG
ncbi:MAG: hypothetical protein L6265_04640 [Thermoplasmatales archaeon]|nr:hypothetical protein [Thermoplasmatales archaeon]